MTGKATTWKTKNSDEVNNISELLSMIDEIEEKENTRQIQSIDGNVIVKPTSHIGWNIVIVK